MSQLIPFLAILTSEATAEFAHQLARAMGYPQAELMVGTPASAATQLASSNRTPHYMLIEIGSRGQDILPEIDQLAEHCTADTRVVVFGQTNDIQLYRALVQRGVQEYFIQQPEVQAAREAMLTQSGGGGAKRGKVFSFMSAASGDGASTLAVNTAYALARFLGKSTVLVDMDFQFGMIARNLDLTTTFGIKELFEHTDRAIDNTLLNRMLVRYDDVLDVVAAPTDLRLWPDVPPDVIRQLIDTLTQKFDYVVIDLPHIWSSWLATALTCSDKSVLTAQLWLRSVTHTARLLGAWQDVGVTGDQVVTVINRSGAKFKEAVTARDYESVCRRRIDCFITNDIKTIVTAENEGKTVLETGNSLLAKQLRDMAEFLAGVQPSIKSEVSQGLNQNSTKAGLSLGSLFSKS
jgi:pilus assembly protein CpaE